MTITSHQVCILLGSNILPDYYLPQAIAQLGQRILIARVSSIWETAAVGSPGPNFLNAAVLAHTQLHPFQLKEKVLRPLEAEMGRIRSEDKNAARTIDLDIVAYDGRPVERDLWQYAHAALPVAELLPEMTQPVSGISLQIAAQQLARLTAISRRTDLKAPVFFDREPIETARLAAPVHGLHWKPRVQDNSNARLRGLAVQLY